MDADPADALRQAVQRAFVNPRDAESVDLRRGMVCRHNTCKSGGAAFGQFDTDMSGFIERGEMQAILAKYGINQDGSADIALQAVLNKCDSDHNGDVIAQRRRASRAQARLTTRSSSDILAAAAHTTTATPSTPSPRSHSRVLCAFGIRLLTRRSEQEAHLSASRSVFLQTSKATAQIKVAMFI